MTEAVQSYLDAIPLPAVFIGIDRRILGANAAALSIQINAATPLSFVLVFRQPALSDALDRCIATKDKTRVSYTHNEGSLKTRYDVSFAYVSGNMIKGVLMCFQDTTEMEQAGEIRREFVANVSHELRTPLTALLGFIETLQGPARDDVTARTRFLDIMSVEATRMNRLVGDLLSLSRVEENERSRPKEQIDLTRLLQTVVGNLNPVAKANDVTLSFASPTNCPTIAADPDQMMQVFTNLIENAIKYGGAQAEVSIALQHLHRDRQLRKPALQIDITDTGPGIEALHIPRLTERFYRIDSHRSREKGGTGLGLAIVKHIINRHRGRLNITSTPGQGSVFSVVLPLE